MASGDGVLIKGQKTVLREKRITDAPDDYAWRTDEELARLDATRPISMSYDEFLTYSKDELKHPSPLSKRLGIDTQDGRHIGNCMYYDIGLRQGEAELGIMIGDRDYWGRGYGTDSLEALLSHLFTSTQLSYLYLHTLEWNNRARRAFAKAGLQEVKKERRNGQDFILMAVRRTEWERHTGLRGPASKEGHAAAPGTDAVTPAV